MLSGQSPVWKLPPQEGSRRSSSLHPVQEKGTLFLFWDFTLRPSGLSCGLGTTPAGWKGGCSSRHHPPLQTRTLAMGMEAAPAGALVARPRLPVAAMPPSQPRRPTTSGPALLSQLVSGPRRTHSSPRMCAVFGWPSTAPPGPPTPALSGSLLPLAKHETRRTTCPVLVLPNRVSGCSAAAPLSDILVWTYHKTHFPGRLFIL